MVLEQLYGSLLSLKISVQHHDLFKEKMKSLIRLLIFLLTLFLINRKEVAFNCSESNDEYSMGDCHVRHFIAEKGDEVTYQYAAPLFTLRRQYMYREYEDSEEDDPGDFYSLIDQES